MVSVIFKNEFNIDDFRNTSRVINFDDLQTEWMKERIGAYRPALACVFNSDEVRSILGYYYQSQDKKPALNLLKQLLAYYGYRFSRSSEYQGNHDGKKVYKSRYVIVKLTKSSEQDPEQDMDPVHDQDNEPEPEKIKSKIKINLLRKSSK